MVVDLMSDLQKLLFPIPQVNTTNDTAKDAKNDSTTTSDSFKESWKLKQDFIWEEIIDEWT